MATLSKLKPNQVLYTVARHKMGNTTISTISIHQVQVKEVHEGYVVASWNYNKPERFYPHSVKSWKLKKPETVPTWNGMGQRLMTREEKKHSQPHKDTAK